MNRPPIARTRDRETTRFVFTPTGYAHVGHAWTAYVNRLLALLSGGVFGYRIEDTLAQTSDAALRELVSDNGCPKEKRAKVSIATGIPESQLTVAHYYGYANIHDMCAIGLGPINCETKWQSQSDITDWYWKNIFEFDEYFGPWPGEMAEGADHHRWGCMLATFAVHPYIALNRVVEDMQMGCTTVLRGEDLKEETPRYMMFAFMIARHRTEMIPALDYLPVLQQSASNAEGARAYRDAETISSSMSEMCKGVRIKDVLAAGISGEKLIHYLERIYFRKGTGDTPEGEDGQWLPSGRVNPGRYRVEAPVATFAALPMNPHPILHREDWERFLATGEVEA